MCEKVSVSYLKRQRDSVCMGRIEENECKSVFVWILESECTQECVCGRGG